MEKFYKVFLEVVFQIRFGYSDIPWLLFRFPYNYAVANSQSGIVETIVNEYHQYKFFVQNFGRFKNFVRKKKLSDLQLIDWVRGDPMIWRCRFRSSVTWECCISEIYMLWCLALNNSVCNKFPRIKRKKKWRIHSYSLDTVRDTIAFKINRSGPCTFIGKIFQLMLSTQIYALSEKVLQR